MIHAMQQVEIPCLAIPLAQLRDALGTCIVRLYFGGAVLLTGRLEGGKMIDSLLFRLGVDIIPSTCRRATVGHPPPPPTHHHAR